MSVASWFLIAWKTALLWRAGRRSRRARAAFWQQTALDDGARAVTALDAGGAADVLVQAALTAQATDHGLAARKTLADRLTAALRDALAQVSARLNFGQVLLASVGSTAPFVGLFGTVWGIYHALTSIAGAGQLAIDKVAGPVGEALIMTAAGLAVAIPAVLAYNVFGKFIHAIEADLEGFAHDLRALLSRDAPTVG
ncbi:MAG: MotA/TolQ/ExbB proton channel family protein [Betaproteobacteria bacterium]|nr:MotA/TolQ/ExbB proton channel family protein [Betaproteobacteria bacterium]